MLMAAVCRYLFIYLLGCAWGWWVVVEYGSVPDWEGELNDMELATSIEHIPEQLLMYLVPIYQEISVHRVQDVYKKRFHLF